MSSNQRVRVAPSTRRIAADAAQTLTQTDAPGVIVRGRADTAHLLSHIRDLLPGRTLWLLSGSSDAETTRFAALSPYLRLPTDRLDEPLTAISALRALRGRLAEETQPAIFVIEQPHRLDLGSETLLAAVAEEGLAQLLVLDRNGALPEELSRLLRQHRLRLIELLPFTTEQLLVELESQLGGIVPWVSALTVQAWCGGVDRWLQPCFRAGVQGGFLAEDVHGAWWTGEMRLGNPELAAQVAEERALLPARVGSGWELLAATGAVSRKSLETLLGAEAVAELMSLDTIAAATDPNCDCVWMSAVLVAEQLMALIPEGRRQRVTESAAALHAETDCRRHGQRARLPRLGVTPASDLAAAIDLVRGMAALGRGDWTQAHARGRAAGGLVLVPVHGHAFSWLHRLVSLLTVESSRRAQPGLAEALEDPELARFPEFSALAVARGIIVGLPQAMDRATTLREWGTAARLLSGIAAAHQSHSPQRLLALAEDALAADRRLIAVAALCAASRLATAQPVLRWRIGRSLTALEAGSLLPADVLKQCENARLTPTEERVAQHALGPGTAGEIAEALSLSSRTVEWHIGRILARFGLESRAAFQAAAAPPA